MFTVCTIQLFLHWSRAGDTKCRENVSPKCANGGKDSQSNNMTGATRICSVLSSGLNPNYFLLLVKKSRIFH